MRQTIVLNLKLGKIRRETLHGRPHVVAGVAMLAEDVIEGSEGPLLYLAEENAKWVKAWNHMPVTVFHPVDGDGNPVSAADPQILNETSIGKLLNAAHDTKLRSEAWIDEELSNKAAPQLIKDMEEGKVIEVSTGLEVEIEKKAGTHKGKKYVGIARNYKPDHLAILPGRKGAYSVEMGGGMPVYNEVQPHNHLTKNELSFSEISSALRVALSAKFQAGGQYWDGWVVDIYDGYIVYCTGGTYWQLDYSVKDGLVSFQGEPVQVQRIVSYESVKNQEKQEMDKKALVDGLIANGGYEESDREWLMGQPDDKFKKIVANAQKPKPEPTPAPAPQPAPAPAPQPTPAPQPQPAPQQVSNVQPQLTAEQYIAAMPPQLQPVFRRGLTMVANETKTIIDGIMANPRNQYSREFLEAKHPDDLAAMWSLLGGQQGGQVQNHIPMFIGANTLDRRVTNAHKEEPMPTVNHDVPALKIAKTA